MNQNDSCNKSDIRNWDLQFFYEICMCPSYPPKNLIILNSGTFYYVPILSGKLEAGRVLHLFLLLIR